MLIWGRWDSPLKEEGELTACGDGVDSLSDDSSMLMLAAQQAMPEAVKELLKYQADPNVTDHLGRSALMMAVTQGGSAKPDSIARGAHNAVLKGRRIIKINSDLDGKRNFVINYKTL